MSSLQRIALPLLNAFFITAGLLYCMFYLVRIDEPFLLPENKFNIPEFNYHERKTKVNPIVVKPPAPPEAKLAPVIQKQVSLLIIDEVKGVISLGKIKRDSRSALLTPGDSQLIVALGFPPVYPPSLIARNIEGYAVVGFSVSASGSVFDAFIIESEPRSVFDRSALKAISKFKYKARMVGGNAVTTTGQRYLFTYKIDE